MGGDGLTPPKRTWGDVDPALTNSPGLPPAWAWCAPFPLWCALRFSGFSDDAPPTGPLCRSMVCPWWWGRWRVVSLWVGPVPRWWVEYPPVWWWCRDWLERLEPPWWARPGMYDVTGLAIGGGGDRPTRYCGSTWEEKIQKKMQLTL